MNARDIILRLKQTTYKSIVATNIKLELRELPYTRRREIIVDLEQEKVKSDNSDIEDVIDDIIDEFNPNK